MLKFLLIDASLSELPPSAVSRQLKNFVTFLGFLVINQQKKRIDSLLKGKHTTPVRVWVVLAYAHRRVLSFCWCWHDSGRSSGGSCRRARERADHPEVRSAKTNEGRRLEQRLLTTKLSSKAEIPKTTGADPNSAIETRNGKVSSEVEEALWTEPKHLKSGGVACRLPLRTREYPGLELCP